MLEAIAFYYSILVLIILGIVFSLGLFMGVLLWLLSTIKIDRKV